MDRCEMTDISLRVSAIMNRRYEVSRGSLLNILGPLEDHKSMKIDKQKISSIILKWLKYREQLKIDVDAVNDEAIKTFYEIFEATYLF